MPPRFLGRSLKSFEKKSMTEELPTLIRGGSGTAIYQHQLLLLGQSKISKKLGIQQLQVKQFKNYKSQDLKIDAMPPRFLGRSLKSFEKKSMTEELPTLIRGGSGTAIYQHQLLLLGQSKISKKLEIKTMQLQVKQFKNYNSLTLKSSSVQQFF